MNIRIIPLLCLVLSTSTFANYAKIQSELEALHKRYPNISEFFSIGKNDQGTEIKGLRIAKDLSAEVLKSHLIVGTHHGNEVHAPDLAVDFTELLLSRVDGNALSKTVDQDSFYIIPVLNVSGYNSRSRREKAANGFSYDPNRDYPDACVFKKTFNLKSTNAIANFISNNDHIVSAVTLHGYIGTFTFPWGIYTKDTETADHIKFLDMAKEAAKHNNYRVGTHTDLIYPADGAFEDWAYHEHGVWVSLLEIQRFTDLKKDALALLEYFNHAPKWRSNQHSFTGRCTKTFASIRSEFVSIGRP